MYDASQTVEKDEDKEESIYAPLLTGAQPPASGPPPSSSAPATPGPTAASASGHVNFDRYLSANQDTVNRHRGDMNKAVESRYKALQTGLNDAQNFQVDVGGAPQAAETLVADSVAEQQHESIANTSATTLDDAKKKAGAKYSGPGQKDVDSKYASLLSERQKLEEEAAAAKMGSFTGDGFEDRLLGTAGGVDYSKVAGVGEAYDKSYGAASQAVKDAEAKHEENRSAWEKLIGTYTPPTTETVKPEDMAQQHELNAAVSRLDTTLGKEQAAKYREALTRMSPEDQAAFAKFDHQKMGIMNYYTALTRLYEDAIKKNPNAFIDNGELSGRGA